MRLFFETSEKGEPPAGGHVRDRRGIVAGISHSEAGNRQVLRVKKLRRDVRPPLSILSKSQL
jgi:hypothetical protein